MKKLTTVSLFIFGVVVTAILVAGLVFYQDNKNIQSSTPKNIVQSTINQINSKNGNNTTTNTIIPTKTIPVVNSLILNMSEIARHNKQTDCWMLISGKVYNITSYFGKHPGGSGAMSLTCGKDATAAYYTQDPYATNSSTRSAHSSRAKGLLDNYYLGNLNQTIK